MGRRRPGWRVPALLVVAVVALLEITPADAVFGGKPSTPIPRLRSNTNTHFVFTHLGPGQGVQGFIANEDNPFDPVGEGYPLEDPTTGFTPKDEGFAGILHGTPTGGGEALSLFCIDIHTLTNYYFGYRLGTWEESGVANVGYVARLLNEYYPNTNEPAGLTDLEQKAAAVQSAIWFFSDNYVLRTSSPLHDAVAAIVSHIIAAGALTAPPPPSLTLNPSTVSGPAGHVVGPFTVTTSAPEATVTATGADMFSDAAGTMPIADGSTVPSGHRIWVRSTGPSSAVLQATSKATVPTGNVYIYDGNAGVNDAQRLILASTADLVTSVQATAEFLAPGSLRLTKTIAGPAAGSQGEVVIQVACDDGVDRRPLVIAPEAPAGSTSHTYTDIPAGTICTVTETSNGSVVGTDVVVTGDGRQVTIRSGERRTVRITDTYHFVGSLLVRKTISGPGAGQQGEITIHTVCDGTALTPDFVIAAGTPAGDEIKQYDGIPAGATCTVTETADGSNGGVSVVVDGSGQNVPITAGDIVEADLSDTYGLSPGELEVTKTITGPLAGQQGTIVIRTVCNGTALTPDFVIAAGTPAGLRSEIYSNVPAPANCVVTETADGHTGTVSVVVAGSPQTVAIAPGGAGAAAITDTYGPAGPGAGPGSLLVRKTITGPGAGQQEEITIHTVCDGTALPDFVVAAGTPAGDQTKQYDGLPAGATCTVTETADGSTGALSVVVVGSGQSLSVPAGDIVEADVSDAYGLAPGQLAVTKTIAGPLAGAQGAIVIRTVCNGTALTPDFVIAARTPASTQSHIYSNVPAPASCVVTETSDGHTSTVPVVVTGNSQTVAIAPGGAGAAHITDTYRPTPGPGGAHGSLFVTHTIAGPLAGHQGPITIRVVCNGTARSPDFTIAARTGAGSVSHSFDGIPARSVCTLNVIADGATPTIAANVSGHGQKVTIPAGKVVPVNVMAVYQRVSGSLGVIKTIAGPAARQHGHIAILVACGGPIHRYAFRIPARRGPGSLSRFFARIPAGSRCTVSETANGATRTVAVFASGRRRVTIRANRRATAHLTDSFRHRPKHHPRPPKPSVTGYRR